MALLPIAAWLLWIFWPTPGSPAVAHEDAKARAGMGDGGADLPAGDALSRTRDHDAAAASGHADRSEVLLPASRSMSGVWSTVQGVPGEGVMAVIPALAVGMPAELAPRSQVARLDREGAFRLDLPAAEHPEDYVLANLAAPDGVLLWQGRLRIGEDLRLVYPTRGHDWSLPGRIELRNQTAAQWELPGSWQVLLVNPGDARILAAAEPVTGPVWTGSLTVTAKTGVEHEGIVQLVALGSSRRIRIAAVGFATRAACAAALRDGIVLDVAATMVVVPPMPGGAAVDRLRLVCDGEPDWLASSGPVVDGSVWLPLQRGGYTATGFAAGPATAGQSIERQAIGRLVVGDGAPTVVWAVELPGAHALDCRIVDASQQPAPGVRAHFRYLGSAADVRHDGWTEERSDEDGRIRITGLLAGDYSVTIRGQDKGQQATYRVAVPGTATLVLPAANRILLDYAFPLAGLVDGMDEPRVWLRPLGTTDWRPAGTTVDYFAAVGVLRAVEPSTYEFAATATDMMGRHWCGSSSAVIAPTDAVQVVRLSMHPVVVHGGRIAGPRPAGRVVTTLADAALRLPWQQATSGADGRFAVLAPPGSRPEVVVFDADARRIVGRARLDERREVVIHVEDE